jgi:hypothetical protein
MENNKKWLSIRVGFKKLIFCSCNPKMIIMGGHVAYTWEEISMWHFEGECDIKRPFGRPSHR